MKFVLCVLLSLAALACAAGVLIDEPSPGALEVTCSSGLRYRATDYSSATRTAVSWQGSLLLGSFSLPRKEFNRLRFEYEFDGPVLMSCAWLEEGKPVTEAFYLEAGKKTFSCLIGGFARGKKAAGLRSVILKPLKGLTTGAISDISLETVPVPKEEDVYLSDSRARVGITLLRGGGVSYFEDKRCRVKGLGNLINRADEGRLIQQSYYGDKASPDYRKGSAFGKEWPYNPVQGGDRYGNRSRLIDFEQKGSSLYVKSQPMDWGLDGAITPSYMENTYTLKGGVLTVRNRFTDFSGMPHTVHNQEVPAFYTVSYLDRFLVCRQGNKETADGLPFWGDGSSECFFETGGKDWWCAWISAADNFGIGLCTPAAGLLVAGRFSYDGSKDPAAGSTNYAAPLISTAIRSFEPLEYTYLVASGSPEEIENAFDKNRIAPGNFAGYR
ncbi:MAG: hypothetical protein IJT95_04085 [Abditibacteriota bacterium]|nr:hypothetical protein [Abditibacteriota bacterium]